MSPGPQRNPRSAIGLAMIVKNEAAVIERCLSSVRLLIDTWTIVDTGSTDDTRERIGRLLDDVPGRLYQRSWRDFGANRTELMDLARGTADYLLLIDADMTVRIDGALPQLTGDGYHLVHHGPLRYKIPRLVRGDLDWRYEGATHEYLDGGPNHPIVETLDALVIVHHADGGSRADKFTRDRRLLEAVLDEHPHDPRTLFCLAQTYADLGENELAIDTYRRRVAAGGWAEEAFVAQLRIGDLLERRDFSAAVPEWLAAWNLRPTRAEPLYRLARGYRTREQHWLAGVFARTGLAVGFPDTDVLFVDREPYDYGLQFELSIAAYWGGNVAGSLAASEALLEGATPDWLLPLVHHNIVTARRALHSGTDSEPVRAAPSFGWVAPDAAGTHLLGERIRGVIFELLEVDPAVIGEVGWPGLNPSMAQVPDGFMLVIRHANTVRHANGTFEPVDGGPVIRTRNVLRQVNASWECTRERLLDESPTGPPLYPSLVCGVEDVRPVPLGDRVLALGTCRDRNVDNRCQMVLWNLGRVGFDDETAPLRVLEGPDHLEHEKNWMPFVVDGALHAVYACSPLIVVRIDPATGSSDEVSRTPALREARHLRGGSQGIEYEPGRWLFIAHEACVPGADDETGTDRIYVHRLIEVAASADGPATRFDLERCSPRFSFTGAPIGFCAGLVLDGDDLVASFGVNDAQALLARFPLEEALDLLQPEPLHESLR